MDSRRSRTTADEGKKNREVAAEVPPEPALHESDFVDTDSTKALRFLVGGRGNEWGLTALLPAGSQEVDEDVVPIFVNFLAAGLVPPSPISSWRCWSTTGSTCYRIFVLLLPLAPSAPNLFCPIGTSSSSASNSLPPPPPPMLFLLRRLSVSYFNAALGLKVQSVLQSNLSSISSPILQISYFKFFQSCMVDASDAEVCRGVSTIV